MYRQAILQLIEECKDARRAGVSLDQIRQKITLRMQSMPPREFLEWVREDREYCAYYYDAQQSGACAKAAEVVALILEAMVTDALD